jgi:hypothetical protein
MGKKAASWQPFEKSQLKYYFSFLHPYLSQVTFSVEATQCFERTFVLIRHPVVPPLVPLCTIPVGVCFTVIF